MYYNLEFFLSLAVIVSGLFLLLAKCLNSNHRLLSISYNIGSLFWVLLLVLIIRSFIIEPFRIPSGSMLPTLEIGDFILVNKFTYGLRLPVFRNKLIEIGQPSRGDVVVFKYPSNPAQDFIKRVVGVPGDVIRYLNKVVYVNDQASTYQAFPSKQEGEYATGLQEDLFGHEHLIQINPHSRSMGGKWVVPEGHYFVMGDNRDNSNDSRRWGFVPESHLLGRAFMVWMHWNWNGEKHLNFSRVGNSIE
ncbi:MAG: signal peptidase I [Candidatus Oxydemutatoraceae bacterium WSBS_2016_MAG_OTU14]